LNVTVSSVVPLAQILAWAVCSGVNVVTDGASGLLLKVSHILTLAIVGAAGWLLLALPPPPQALSPRTSRAIIVMDESKSHFFMEISFAVTVFPVK
jgi:hypothetical protein